MRPAAQKAMFWRTVCHYILSRSVVLLVVSWLFSWSEIEWNYVSSSSSEIIMMRYNSSNFAWIGGYMVKLWSPYCLHHYVFCGLNWMGLLNIHKVLKVAHWRYIFWSLKSQSFFINFRCIFCYEIFIVFSFSYLCLVRVYFLIKNNCFLHLIFAFFVFNLLHHFLSTFTW